MDKNSYRLAITAIASSALTLGAVYAHQKWGESKPQLVQQKKFSSSSYDSELIDEQLARNITFLGKEGVDRIRDSKIVVVGAGGVGSWVATMLVRSGVGKVRIIDFDQVTLSSLNRHACATLEDVGKPKVDCIARYLNKVAPWVEIEPVVSLWTKDTMDLLLFDGQLPTYVIDCIDNIDTKVDLLDYCYNRLKVPVISSMGAGCKADATRIQIGDLSTTIEDSLSRSVRNRLRSRGIKTGIPVVFSTEKPGKAKLLDLDESLVDQGPVDQLSVLQDFRVRILPVLGTLPAIFGLTIATHIIATLGGYNSVVDPVQGGYSLTGKNRPKLYENALQGLVGQIARLNWPMEGDSKIPMSIVDSEYLIEEVFKGKSVISGEGSRLVFSIWDPTKPVYDLENVVLMTTQQQRVHEQQILRPRIKPEQFYSKQIISVAEQRMKMEKWYRTFR
jgi:tRNA A37 threonylcarbamoyladenosine dehydratase